MSYEKLNLKVGEILKANHIAHIEDGISKCISEEDVSKNYQPKGEYMTSNEAKSYINEQLGVIENGTY